ncbi:hypothetical protein ACHGLA_15530 [Streptomyces sp. YH02]|uniref:hypothetical protein n=1 Tax=Streptomyces sp. YH02 TaxID=3256999 RepID=UPI003756976A
MPASGCSWCRRFRALPREARNVRDWTASRIAQPDAPLVAHELFVGCLAARPDSIEMTLSTAGDRIRITARGPEPLTALCSHGPGLAIVRGLSSARGVVDDGRALWAEMHPDSSRKEPG